VAMWRFGDVAMGVVMFDVVMLRCNDHLSYAAVGVGSGSVEDSKFLLAPDQFCG
jgi:hypothetical protein